MIKSASTHKVGLLKRPITMGMKQRSFDVEEGTEALSVSSSDEDEPVPPPRFSSGTFSQLVVGALGIYTAYLYYGHVQEDIFRFEDDGKKFTYAWFLQMLESVINMAVGYAIKRYNRGKTEFPLFPFYSSGTSQLFSKVFTSLSLAAGLSFPVMTLAKCAKIVPVMLGEIAFGGSKYKTNDYIYAAAIVGGTTLLSLSKSDKGKSAHTTPLGIILILLSLFADGTTAGLQKKMINGNQDLKDKPKSYDFLLYTNMAMAIVAFFIAIVTGDLFQGHRFLADRPGLAIMIAQLCCCSALGQVFVFYIIANFSPQMCAMITTSRKILSVGWSITMKGHYISNQGALGLAIATIGMVLEVHSKVRKCGKRPEPAELVK